MIATANGSKARTITAKFHGTCKMCGERTRKGIHRISKHPKLGWVHETCYDSPLPAGSDTPDTPDTSEPKPMTIQVEVAPESAEAVDAAVRSAVETRVAEMQDSLIQAIASQQRAAIDSALAIIRQSIEESLPPRDIVVHTPIGEVAIEGEVVAAEMEDILFHMETCGEDIFLVGPTGCGKTYIIEQAARMLGRKFAMISCTAGMSEAALTGTTQIDSDGSFQFVGTDFIDCYENGGIFLLDESDGADPNVLLLINAALSNGSLPLPKRKGNTVAKRHPDFRCVMAANTFGRGADRAYVGRNPLDAATLDRFASIECDYCEEVEKTLCPNAELFAQLMTWRKRIMDNRLPHFLTTRFVKRARKYAEAGKPLSYIFEQLTKGWPERSIEAVRD